MRGAGSAEGVGMYLFLIPLLLGFALVGASAFTTACSLRWGERGGRMATSILRNLLGIPLGVFGFVLAWLQPASLLFGPGGLTKTLAWLLLLGGSVPFLWGHLVLGRITHTPSVRDTLVRHGLYSHVRHPIYAGGMVLFAGLALLKPTSTVLLACLLGIGYLVVQARLEEIDLVQRLPAYREYVEDVPRFVPRLRRRDPQGSWTGAGLRGQRR